MNNVVTIEKLYKSLGGKPILIDLTLNIPKGTLFGILGPNGAGKSTTLKLLTGNLKPTSGKISVLGHDPWKNRVKVFKSLGYLPQNPTAPSDLRVLDYVVYMCRLRGFSKTNAYIEARDVLLKVGLEKFEGNTVGKLSGGEIQRLGFANALLGDPEILILDEPTASLDPEGRVYIMDLIQKMARDQSQTVIISSHILPEIQRMTNHIAIMSEGKVLVSGSMAQLTEDVYDKEYVIECDQPEKLFEILKEEGFNAKLEDRAITIDVERKLNTVFRQIPKLCAENDLKLKSFRPVRDALENVFLTYVSKMNKEKRNVIY